MKILLKKTIVICFTIISSTLWAGGFTFGFSTGLNPNVLHFNHSVAKTRIEFQNYANIDNASNPGNTSIEDTSSSITGIPIGFNARYLERFYLIKLGFLYHFSFGGTNSYTTNQNGTPRTITDKYSMRMLEIPLTFAFNIRNDSFTRFYAGAGPTLFWGSALIEHDNGSLVVSNGSTLTTVPNEDVYSGWALGAHLVLGGEVSLSSNLSLSMELVFNYGNKANVKDQIITSDNLANVQQVEDENTADVLGVYTTASDNKDNFFNPEHPSGLDFTGMELIFSVHYFPDF